MARLCFITLVALALVAPESAVAQPPARAAVVALDDTSSSRGLDAEAARILRPTQMTVLQGDELDAWVRRRREPQPDPATLERFAPATQTIARGVERFFYMSPDRALPSIQPVLDLAWHHPAVLAFRPDLADQIWQAGIVLVRAYMETKGADEAQRQAVRLVTLLPTRQTDPKIVPPDTRTLLEKARESLAAGGATIRLSAPDPERCTLYLNGAVAVPQQTYVVDPQGAYFARADCSEPTPPPIWRVHVAANESREAHVPPIEPQSYRPENFADPAERRSVEWYLQAVAAAADTDVAVGVASVDDAIVLVRFDRASQTITWSDDDYADSIRRGMPRIFPEYARVFSDDPEPQVTEEAPRGADWVAIASVSTGAVAAGLGTWMVVAANRQSRLLDCAVNNPAPPAGRNCAGLADDIFFAEFETERRRTRSLRAGGYVLLGAGFLTVAYGIFRFVRPRRVVAGLSVTPRGVEVRW